MSSPSPDCDGLKVQTTSEEMVHLSNRGFTIYLGDFSLDLWLLSNVSWEKTTYKRTFTNNDSIIICMVSFLQRVDEKERVNSYWRVFFWFKASLCRECDEKYELRIQYDFLTLALLTLSWRRSLSYKNETIGMLCNLPLSWKS